MNGQLLRKGLPILALPACLLIFSEASDKFRDFVLDIEYTTKELEAAVKFIKTQNESLAKMNESIVQHENEIRKLNDTNNKLLNEIATIKGKKDNSIETHLLLYFYTAAVVSKPTSLVDLKVEKKLEI